MKRVWHRISADIRNYWQIGAAILVYDIVVQILFGQFCPSVIVTGLPCPGCGMTRSVLYFAAGQFEKGMEMNPLGIFWLFLAVYFCLMRYVFGKKPVGVMQIGGGLVVLMAAFYLYRMYACFPGEVPICYTPGNIMERTKPGYAEEIPQLIAGIQNKIRYIADVLFR